MNFDLSRRALALLEAGRPITAKYANAVIAAQQCRPDDFHKIRIVDGSRSRDRYQWTQKVVEELAAYRRLASMGLAHDLSGILAHDRKEQSAMTQEKMIAKLVLRCQSALVNLALDAHTRDGLTSGYHVLAVETLEKALEEVAANSPNDSEPDPNLECDQCGKPQWDDGSDLCSWRAGTEYGSCDGRQIRCCPDCKLPTFDCRCGTVGADDYDEYAAWEKEHCEPEPEPFTEDES